MALSDSGNVTSVCENNKRPVDDVDLDELAFDQFNDATFSAMEEWNPKDDSSIGNEDAKKEDSKDPNEIMTLINSSFNSLDLDLSSEDRELPLQTSDSGIHLRASHPTWIQKHFDDLPTQNYGKRMTSFPGERRIESLCSQNTKNYVEDRTSREFEEELRLRSDPYAAEHARSSRYPAPPTGRRGSANFGINYYKDTRNQNVMSPHAFPRRNSTFRQDNFDLRNAETFGIDAVERMQFGNVPSKQQMSYSRSENEFMAPPPHAGYAEDSNSRCLEIRDPRVQDLYLDTCRKMHMEPVYTHLEQAKEDIPQQLNDFKNTALEHLKNIAGLVPQIEAMEDVFDRFVDPEDPPNELERFELLDRLKHHVTPQNVLPFSKLVHARRLLMHSLSIMSREKRYRAHALEILEEIFRNLVKLLYEDRNDMVFGMKNLVFQRIISRCSMEEIIRLTRCLLVNNCDMAIESKLGLCFIGCLLETAGNLDFKSYPAWTETWLPKFRNHLLKVQRYEVILTIVREPGLRHLLDNTKDCSKPRTPYDTIRSPAAY